MLGKGVGAAFTAIAPNHVGTTLVLWLEFEAGQRGLFSLAVRRTALLGKGVGATFSSIVSSRQVRLGADTLLSLSVRVASLRTGVWPFHFRPSNGFWAQSFGAVFTF